MERKCGRRKKGPCGRTAEDIVRAIAVLVKGKIA